MNELKEYLNKITRFPKEEIELFISLFSEKHLSKNEALVFVKNDSLFNNPLTLE